MFQLHAHIAHLPTGHAGAMLQARQLGTELLVGVHSDEAILENKGPTVMRLDERCAWQHPPQFIVTNTTQSYGR
jgi:glycerol-3-phosphate cytidylyltransferase-like family protein